MDLNGAFVLSKRLVQIHSRCSACGYLSRDTMIRNGSECLTIAMGYRLQQIIRTAENEQGATGYIGLVRRLIRLPSYIPCKIQLTTSLLPFQSHVLTA